jgi:hypothetical protein
VKVNWDAALNSKGGCIGLGIVARDSQGCFLGAKCVVQHVVVDPKTTKAMAALWAVQFCKESGLIL